MNATSEFYSLYKDLVRAKIHANYQEEALNKCIRPVAEQFISDITPHIQAFNERYRQNLDITRNLTNAELYGPYGTEEDFNHVTVDFNAGWDYEYVEIPAQYFTDRPAFLAELKSLHDTTEARYAENHRKAVEENIEKLTRELAEAQDYLKNL